MEIACRSCGANIPPDHLDLDRGIAQCAYCDAVVRIPGVEPSAPTPPARATAPQPKGMTIEEDAHGVRIIRRWFRPAIIALLLFTLFWDGFMVVWFTIAITQGVWFMALFGLLHGAVGVGLSYSVVASFVNRTIIEINERELSIRHEPLPWPGNKTLPTLEVDQLYCQHTESHGKNGATHRYGVHARLRDGRAEELASFNDAQEALFLEQRVEQILGLEDEAVAGAYTG